ncbi:hypothetical protein G5C51_41600, partial [Streptomyces sp. A7024]|nr:hypothetical protein [Streptomyces coryli]
EPHLAVTGAKLGEMTVTTSRGPATVPAWVFTLDGYPSPLKRSAVVPSRLPRSPIRRTSAVPGSPLEHLVRISADGRTLTVRALHGVCDDGAVVTALETRGSVVLSGSVKGAEREEICTAQGKLEKVTVRLKRPVGDRVLLDAITGRPVPYRPEFGPTPSWS